MSYFYKENPAIEKTVDLYFERLSEENEREFNGELSVFLLGSLSRGEGTWIAIEKGFKLLSDIEFFTVYPSGFSEFEKWNGILDMVKNEVFSGENSILFHIDNTYVCIDSLGTLERKLLTFDGVSMGYTVVGKDVHGRFPRVTIENINYYDIRDIMTHRVFSVMYYGFRLRDSGDTVGYRYSLAKNSLDLMTVLLVCNGILLSGFVNRYNAIKELDLSDEIKEYFGYCLNIKLGVEQDEKYDIAEMEGLFISISDSLYKQLRIPFRNIRANIKSIVRRELGKMKRAIRYKHIPVGNHYRHLSKSFSAKRELSKRELKDNLVVNGYPIINKL